ncbi:120_t:CDS:1, partial [Acaulospora morrowiae]
APEAFWRLSEYEMQEKSHTIIRLPVHLPNKQNIFFSVGNEAKALHVAQTQHTMLTAWFKLNENDINARTIIYHNIPLFYMFQKSTKIWKKRVKYTEKIIGRMYTVYPSDMERFCLRLLLLHTPGAISFEDLRTVNNYVYTSFHEAALMRELLDDDNE